MRRAIETLMAQDPRLAEWIPKLPKFKVEIDPLESVSVALTHSIVYQQLHGKAAATILGRFLALLPRGKLEAKHVLALPDQAARGAGLSASKWAAIRDLAEKQLSGVIPSVSELEHLSDQDVVDRLTEVRGVGPWTVHMLLMFRLGRLDVMPSTDYGVRHGFKLAYKKRELPPPRALEKHAERYWRPYRSVASWYMWRIVEHTKRPS